MSRPGSAPRRRRCPAARDGNRGEREEDHGKRAARRRTDRREPRRSGADPLLELEDDLKPTAAQRAVWAGYYDKVSRLADDVVRNRNEVRFPKGTAPEQLDFIAQTVRNRMTAVEDIADAGKALYAVLNAEQKAMADNRLARIPLPLVVPTLAVADQIGRFPPRNAAPPMGNDR